MTAWLREKPATAATTATAKAMYAAPYAVPMMTGHAASGPMRLAVVAHATPVPITNALNVGEDVRGQDDGLGVRQTTDEVKDLAPPSRVQGRRRLV